MSFTLDDVTFLSTDFVFECDDEQECDGVWPQGPIVSRGVEAVLECECGRFCSGREAVLEAASDCVTDWNAYLEYASKYGHNICGSYCSGCGNNYVARAMENGATNFDHVAFAALRKGQLGCWNDDGGCGVVDTFQEWVDEKCAGEYKQEGAALTAARTLYEFAAKAWPADHSITETANTIVETCEMTGTDEALADTFLFACEKGLVVFLTKIARAFRPSPELIQAGLASTQQLKTSEAEMRLRTIFGVGLQTKRHDELRIQQLNRDLKVNRVSALRKFCLGLAARPLACGLSAKSHSTLRLLAQLLHLGNEEEQDILAILDSAQQ
uniref:Uncharacterized protein n=1 Tax=Marseillevirus LCMAC103 TaxID=2506604 RepID=A0A481YVC4_9VIRU|nr:MAG: hypothetical protein LCMAC103_01890 [Marseillevirus LCMAC103]